MPTETQIFNTKWKNYGGAKSLVLSPADFREHYLYGVPLCNPFTGLTLSDDVYEMRLLAAQQRIENELGIKLTPQLVEEQADFVREEFMNFGYIKTSFPILKPCRLAGRLNEREVVVYPQEWLSVRRDNVQTNQNNLFIIPNGAASVTFQFLTTQYPHYFSYFGSRILPNYWGIKYVSGFKQIPEELIELIGIVASIYILPQLEYVVGGGHPLSFGLASQSVSLDGLSQSVSKVNGGNIFQNRLRDYGERLKNDIQRLKQIYGGIKFDVC